MKTKSITIGKSRKIRHKRGETWIKVEITAEFQEVEPTIEDVEDLNADLEEVLRREEEHERAYWSGGEQEQG